ncbi:hypothetical protein [Nonlabens ponticola]|uniref:Uncharacterized protein n=1 Tax=Nonlabens ponticola TaxID=2496866 RepID=A0A3S9MXA8_9FLAO|nr:hypothetical protein [Nonlabens ponticola]AZQ43777.1 hypothetical protein EJ995_05865 [Nonlabens ponticola]
MSQFLNQINQIELKIRTLIEENNRLAQEHAASQERIASLEKDLNDAQETLKTSNEHIVALKTANAMLGSDDYKAKTKLKINALVREIDQCIAQLA